MRAFRGILFAVGTLLITASSVHAQAIGQIFGKVSDATGAILPGVTVTVTGTGLQQPLIAVTTPTGAYTFPSVPIGTYTVTFELSGFKKAVWPDVKITTGFAAMIDMKLEIGTVITELSVTAVSPVVDTKKTTTGDNFSLDILNNVPTARDPWQIINMAPAVTLSGVNVGGSASGQQLTPAVYGTTSNVQWNIEGGNITDMASNSSASYYNFDSFQEIQVVTGGGDVSVQSSGLFINLVTKSGSNVFKGSTTLTFENASMQSQNVTEALFLAGGSNGTGLSGNPLHKIGNYSAEYGGPIKRNRLWFWGAGDKQDINVGVANFFDTSNPACVPPPSTFAQLSQVQKCLVNDQTTINDLNGKVNYQLNAANRFQFLFTTDNKVRNHRGADASTAPEATFRQYAPYGLFGYFTPQLTHTWILSDKLVFTNQMTYVKGGFSLDYQDWDTACGSSQYGRIAPTDPKCQWNVQPVYNRTVNYQSRGPNNVNYSERPSWEVKTDGNYFLSHFLGGDHSLKFGVGWRQAHTLSYTHYGGGVTVGSSTTTSQGKVQCVGNVLTGCGAGLPVAVGSGPGIVPYQAVVQRDSLGNTVWQTWSSYIQDSYSYRRLRINGGVRQDWQTSTFLGGCVPANVILPNLLPQQCQEAADPNHPFNNFSPRASVTYDLRGNGKTAIRSSYSYYFDTEVILASGLSNLGGVSLTWGPNLSSGACSTTAGASCWTDANHDNLVQADELVGTPTPNTARFDTATGILSNVLPVVDPDVKIARTREAIVGVDHELMPNLRVGLDFIYRKYDRGTQTYTIGYEPGAPGFPLSNIYIGPVTYTDPATGISAPYYVVCPGCTRPSGAAGTTITGTSLSYQTYRGVSATVARRLVNRWQLQGSFTWNDQKNYFPLGSYTDPQGVEWTNGRPGTGGTNGNPRYQVKLFGSVQLPFGFNSGANLQVVDGSIRTLSINGPGQVYGGTTGTINRGTLAFEPLGTTRYKPTKLLDVNVSRAVTVPGSKLRATFTLDCFNIFNINTIRSYSSSNISMASSANVSSIVPPRVFRVGARVQF